VCHGRQNRMVLPVNCHMICEKYLAEEETRRAAKAGRRKDNAIYYCPTSNVVGGVVYHYNKGRVHGRSNADKIRRVRMFDTIWDKIVRALLILMLLCLFAMMGIEIYQKLCPTQIDTSTATIILKIIN